MFSFLITALKRLHLQINNDPLHQATCTVWIFKSIWCHFFTGPHLPKLTLFPERWQPDCVRLRIVVYVTVPIRLLGHTQWNKRSLKYKNIVYVWRERKQNRVSWIQYPNWSGTGHFASQKAPQSVHRAGGTKFERCIDSSVGRIGLKCLCWCFNFAPLVCGCVFINKENFLFWYVFVSSWLRGSPWSYRKRCVLWNNARFVASAERTSLDAAVAAGCWRWWWWWCVGRVGAGEIKKETLTHGLRAGGEALDCNKSECVDK